MIDIEDFYNRQFESWPQLRQAYQAVADSECLTVNVKGVPLSVRHNPARIRSSAADLSKKAIAERPCFLCAENRPENQLALKQGDYQILVNPYPVFNRHLTIPLRHHSPQRLAGRVKDMLHFASMLPGMTVFYNGPRSGASAPDHFHFQAVPSDELPLWENPAGWPLCRTIVYTGKDIDDVAQRVEGTLISLHRGEEPDVNVYARVVNNAYEAVIIPRKAHRPSCYGSAPSQALISPASVEMAGVIVAPRKEDFDYCSSPAHLAGIYNECGMPAEECSTDKERILSVGIVVAEKLKVDFASGYLSPFGGSMPSTIEIEPAANGTIQCNGVETDGPLLFKATSPDASFTLHNVMIGIGFHWQQHENQSFHGDLEVRLTPEGKLQAVNHVPIETYLRSVVSSEMNANASEEFLKAHAVISRSWVLAQIEPPMQLESCPDYDGGPELVRWYDHEAHKDFDICADDHCQRYQGCTKASTPQVEAALQATRGQVLAYEGNLCDARFSKCCGGKTEIFSTCWQDVDPPYLASFTDPYCGRATGGILSTVLNNYDQSTVDYYQWTMTYTGSELASIIRERTGTDYGEIVAIEPLHRGPSGRIDRLKITGTKLTRIIGKELEIRRTLSPSHLYSSAFTVETADVDGRGVPRRWTFRGRGWGHGVGLCQIGAAVMAAEGHTYREILNFYFPGSQIVTLY